MAVLSLTIPDLKVARVVAAIEHTGFERIEGETDGQFAKRFLINYLMERDLVCRQDTAGSGITLDEELIGETP